MHNKELFLLLIFLSHYTDKVPANIDNETIRLQLEIKTLTQRKYYLLNGLKVEITKN